MLFLFFKGKIKEKLYEFTWSCCVDKSGVVKNNWLTPAASGVVKKTFPGVESCLARMTLLGVEPS